MLHVVDAEHCSLFDVELGSDRSEGDAGDLDVGTAGAESLVDKAGHDDRREPEARIVTAVGCLDFLAACVPVLLRRRFTHVSGDTFGRGEIVHFPSKGS
jgi:hypothetical protein